MLAAAQSRVRVMIARSRSSEAGFGVVEAIVALALCAAIMTTLVTTYPIVARAINRAGVMTQSLDDQRVLAVLSELVRRARPIVYRDSAGSGQLQFEGTSDRVAFISDISTPGAVGGPQRIEILVEAAPTTPGLFSVTLKREILRPVRDERSQAEKRTLIEQVRSARLSYFGAGEAGTRIWHDNWQARDRMPDLVRLEIELLQGVQGPLVLVIRPELHPY